MANKSKYKIGDQIHDWTVLSGPITFDGRSKYLCKCKCGYTIHHSAGTLTGGKSKSCPSCSAHTASHRESGTRLYNIWRGIKSRCNNPNSTPYSNYGERGIRICDEWNNYESFRNWAILNGYNDNLVIDRKENNEDYCPDNCQWITNQENSKNTRRSHNVTAFGETKCFEDWTRDPRCEVHVTTLRRRLDRGIPFEQALKL